MAVTITIGEAAVAIRAATDPDTVDPVVARALGWLFAAGTAMVLRYAPDAPDDAHNGALIRVLGYLYDADPSAPGASRPLEMSGAAAVLAMWRVHRAGAIGPGDGGGGEPDPAPSELPPLPPDGNYILTVRNGVLAWIAFPPPS